MIKVIILSLLLLLTQFGNSYAASKKEEYELQERCGKRADERFKSEYGNETYSDDNGKYIYSYTNHYNNKLNKCFILVRAIVLSKRLPNSTKKEPVYRTETLFDINENKEYGTFSRRGNDNPTECNLLSNFCETEAQWNLLIKPYIEE
jgi:hypothetical protein